MEIGFENDVEVLKFNEQLNKILSSHHELEGNEAKIHRIRTALYFVHEILKPEKMEYHVEEMTPRVGDIIVESNKIEFSDPVWFARILRDADNFDIYPLQNGKVRMTLGFYNVLLKRSEE